MAENDTKKLMKINMFQGIITKNFEDIGIDETKTGYIGLAMAISCSITATVLSFGIPKILKRHLKASCLLCKHIIKRSIYYILSLSISVYNISPVGIRCLLLWLVGLTL